MKHRIVYIIDGLGIGGAERTVFELATRINRERFEPIVVTLSKDIAYGTADIHKRAVYDQLGKAGIPVYVVPKTGKAGMRMYRELTRLLRELNPAIVHTSLFASDVWGATAARAVGVPVVLSTEQNINKDEGWMKHRLKCLTNKKRDAIVCISEAVRQYVKAFCPAARCKQLPVIPNAIPFESFHRGLRDHSPVAITVVGRLVPQKGHARLFAALPLVKQPFQLNVVGEGPLRQSLEVQIRELGLQEKVAFSGARTDIPAILADTDIAIIPSIWEGQGIIALEALASECAVIASNVDGLAEIIQHERTGLLVDMGDSDACAAAIDRLIANSSLRASLGAAGRACAKQGYSVERMVESYEKVYHSLLASTAQRNAS